MISYIRGPLEEKREDSVVVEAGNIGYRIFIPSSVLGELPGLGEEVKIYTYFSVREDGMSLFGFLSRQDLEMFRQLIGVNGVGPKSALGILSALKPDVLRMAVLSGDAKAISKAPGVGAKTAQRIILDLKDKVKAEDVLFAGVESEETGKTEIVALDKTGTITSGEPKVTDLIPADGMTEHELLFFANALEKKSEHPLARAILAKAEENGEAGQKSEITQFQAVPGNGLSGKLGEDWLYGGNFKFISDKMKISASIKEQAEQLAQQGKTPLFFGKNEQFLGMIAVADVIKEDSPQAVKELQNMGIHVVMLTGDNERTAKAIGEQAGVDEVIAGVLPEGKEQVIRKLKEKGKVAMVGDGINDAPALTRADMGIAIGAGTDIAIDAADVVLMKSRLSDVPAAIRMSRATLRNIHENLFWAFFYNAIGIPLAAGIWIPVFGWKLNPMFGAAAMSLSSFCVVTNALRLNLFKMYDASKDRKRKMKKVETAENTVSDIVLTDKNESENKEETKMTKTMKIEGMMCGHCEAAVKKALETLEQVDTAEVSHEAGTAVVTLNSEISNEVLKKTVEDKDYTVTAIED